MALHDAKPGRPAVPPLLALAPEPARFRSAKRQRAAPAPRDEPSSRGSHRCCAHLRATPHSVPVCLTRRCGQAWFKAKQGDLDSQYVLGMCHLHGVQQDKSTKQAASWLSKAATGGHLDAQFRLGLLWLEGKGVTRQDDTEATKWLERAAAANHPDAIFNLGVLCISGTGMPQSGREAAKYFLQAAQLGNREAQFRYATVLEYEVQKLRRHEAEEAAAAAEGQALSEEDEGSESIVDDEDAEESDDDYFGAGEQKQHAEDTPALEPLQPRDVKGKVGELLGIALHWFIKAGKQNHGLAQHKAALLYMLGAEPLDPDTKDTVWHSRPSVVTWGKSIMHALLVREAKPFSRYPSVVTWTGTVRKREETRSPNLEQAAKWHELAANNGVLASAYAIAVAKEAGQGTSVDLAQSFTWYQTAATGQIGDVEGYMTGVEYICPHCQTFNTNRRTKETPKGNNRCRQCKEERYFTKDLLVRNPVDGVHLEQSEEEQPTANREASRGKDMTKFAGRAKRLETKTEAHAEDAKTAANKPKGVKAKVREGNTAANDESTNEALVYNVGGGSMIVIARDRPHGDEVEEVDPKKARFSRQGTGKSRTSKNLVQDNKAMFNMVEQELSNLSDSRPGTSAGEPVLIAGQGTMTAAQVRNSICITHLEYTGTPKIMHMFCPIGNMVHVTVKNEATVDSGLFFVEFYICGKEENYQTSGRPVYGGRVLVPNLEAHATALLSMDVAARCPLHVSCGQNRLWAGIRPWQAKDLPGANLTQLRHKALSQDLVAMLHLGDATYHGQAGVHQDIREAVRWYDQCKGTSDREGNDMASPTSVDVMIMMTGPIPADLLPTCLLRGYQPAWLAFALNLDAKDPSATAIALSKFEQEMVGEKFALIDEEGVPAMWMYHAASTANMSQAQLNLGIWYVHGHHVPRSLPQACYWFGKAAEAGVQEAQYNLGLLLQQGGAIPVDHKRAAALYQQAVDQGHIDAHLSLGMCYLEGNGVETDVEWAVKLLHIPANKGSAIAQFNLGCLYSMGQGVQKNDRMAVSWYIKAAKQGHREAQICYAMALYRGEGTAKDFAHAARLFEEAGKMGHPQAQYNIGVMYARGEGVTSDREQAAFWWEKSAAAGMC